MCVFIPGLHPAGHSGRVFDCNIVSGLNALLAVNDRYNNYSDAVLSVLVLCQFQIVVYLKLFVCWRRYCTGNVYYDMDNLDVCAFVCV